jgi:hypothetical protein
MASLLAKFRIDYSDLKVLPDITKKQRVSTVSFFESLISEFKQTEGSTEGGSSHDPSKKCLILSHDGVTTDKVQIGNQIY